MNDYNNKINLNNFDSRKKTICLVISAGISIRNVLVESSVKGLKDLSKNYNIVFITEKKFLLSYKLKLKVKEIIKKNSLFDKFLHFYSRILFDKLFPTSTKSILRDYPLGGFNLRTYLFNKSFFLVPKSQLLYKILRKIHNKITKLTNRKIRNQLSNLNLKQLICFNPLSQFEYPYLIIGKEFCETSGVFKSFDNISSDGYVPCLPKNLFVWNKLMLNDAYKTYKNSQLNIFSVGSPQYDNLKLYTSRKLSDYNQILYCSNSPSIYPDDPKNIIFLKEFAKKHKFKILLRIHQTDDISRWAKLEDDNIIELYPNKQLHIDANSNVANSIHNKSLQKQILNSFVVISSYSTIIFDSLTLGIPVINLGFDFDKKPFNKSVLRYEKFEHLKHLINLECVDNVRSKFELRERIIHRKRKGFSKQEESIRQNFLKNSCTENIRNTWINNIIYKLNLDKTNI